ncbi:MAG TPA: secretin N-terminal domain-containing protein [Rhodocyclaceae bacterium]
MTFDITLGVSSLFRRSGRGFLVLLLLALTGCSGYLAHREGQQLIAEGKIDEGLAKLEEASREEPGNAKYRISLLSQRSTIINRALTGAETARREGRMADAEKSYRQVLVLDSNNPMARQGLDALITERKHKLVVAEAEALLKKGGTANLLEAAEKLRPVLSENPKQKDALAVMGRIEEARAKEKTPEAKLAATFKKPITLEFRDAPLRSVFDVVAKVSGLNFFFDKDIRPDLKASILAKNTSIEDALRLLLVTNQLEQKVLNENSILIYPNTPQKLKDYQTLSVRTFYLANADVKNVSTTIKTILKTKDMVVDERLGLIIMRDTPEAIRMAERLVHLQDISDPEVMLEVEVLEVQRSRLLELGIQWPSQMTLAPLTIGGSSVTLEDLKHLNSTSLQATLGNTIVNVRKEDQDSNILANPRIRVRNKEKAKVMIGDRVPIITTTSTATGFVSESVSYVDVGIKLEVEPNVYLDEEVAIKVNLEVSNLVKEVISKSGTLSYQIGTRNAATVLRLKDGETQILAGLIQDADRATGNRVPGLGDIPILGRLFGSQKDDSQRNEIVLSITPHVVRSIRRPDLMMAEFDSGTESVIGAKSLAMGAVEGEAKPDAKGDPKAAVKPASAPAQNQAPVPVTPPAQGQAAPPAPATTVPQADAQAIPAATGATPVQLSWQGPPQVKAGEQFSVVLRMTSADPITGLPLLIGFDPAVLQAAVVQEGEFMKQGGMQTNFSQRIDPAQGRVFVASVRQDPGGTDKGANGTGPVVTLGFKALKAGPARISLLSATPEPGNGASPIVADFAINVLP